MSACCAKPSIANMDHKTGLFSDVGGIRSVTNRMCLHCGKHWYGEEPAQEYTRKEWDALINTAFDDVAKPALSAQRMRCCANCIHCAKELIGLKCRLIPEQRSWTVGEDGFVNADSRCDEHDFEDAA